MKCVECRVPMETRRENYRYDECGLPNVVLKGVDVHYCSKCGKRAVTIVKIDQLHGAIAMEVVKKRARLTPVEARFLRKYLGLNGVDLARKLGVDPATVSRWETQDDKTMSTQADRLLRFMVAANQREHDYFREHLEDVAVDDPAPLRIGLCRGDEGWDASGQAA